MSDRALIEVLKRTLMSLVFIMPRNNAKLNHGFITLRNRHDWRHGRRAKHYTREAVTEPSLAPSICISGTYIVREDYSIPQNFLCHSGLPPSERADFRSQVSKAANQVYLLISTYGLPNRYGHCYSTFDQSGCFSDHLYSMPRNPSVPNPQEKTNSSSVLGLQNPCSASPGI